MNIPSAGRSRHTRGWGWQEKSVQFWIELENTQIRPEGKVEAAGGWGVPNEFVGTCAFFLGHRFDREGFLTARGACRFWRDVSVAGCRINLSAYTDKFCFEFFVIRWAGHASAHHRWWWDGVGIQPVGEQEDG